MNRTERVGRWAALVGPIAFGAVIGACSGSDFSSAPGGAGGTSPDASLDASGGGGGTEAGADAGEPGVGVIGEACEPPNGLACAGHAQKLVLFCDPVTGVWQALQSCSGSMLCDTQPGPNQGSCQEPEPMCIGLEPGATICEGYALVTCGPDLITAAREDCPAACENGACVGSCRAGAARCEGLVPQECDATGEYQDGAPCPFVCEDGKCTGLCKPGDGRCDGDVPQTCDSSGQWVTGSPCPILCSAGKCTDSCVVGELQCNGYVPQICTDAGVWQDGTPCPFVCEGGSCAGICEPGTRQCEGKVPQTCSADGQWKSGAECSYVCSAGDCTGVCVPGSKQCVGLEPETCSDLGQWVTGTPCTYVCALGACTGVCTPGEKKCDGKIPQECDGLGQWGNGSPCPILCTAGTCTGNCTPGATQCNGKVPQTCDNSGEWTSGAPCPFVCTNGVCSGECVPDTTRCDGTTVQTCSSAGIWVNSTTCPYACQQGECTGVCVPGTKQCSGNKVQTCQSDGQWDAGTSCGTGQTCQSGQCVGISAPPPSCAGLPAACGPQGNASCCLQHEVPSVTLTLPGQSGTWGTVQISSFMLDVYEVSVGRFAKFIEAGKAVQSGAPPVGAGAHPNIPGSGWQNGWNSLLQADPSVLEELLVCDEFATWIPQAEGAEGRPINCVTWYEMFAFCIWDGGRLPTEHEWYVAAAGGAEIRLYPWGNTTPDPTYAVYNCASGSAVCSPDDILKVGSRSTKGDGRWTHADLAGNLYEAVLDTWTNTFPVLPCLDCANIGNGTSKVMRGGCYNSSPAGIANSNRGGFSPTERANSVGFRCVRAIASVL